METKTVKITKRLCSDKVQSYVKIDNLYLIVKEDKEKGKLTLKEQSRDKKTFQISKSRFDWEYIGAGRLLKELKQEQEKVKEEAEFDYKKMSEEQKFDYKKMFEEQVSKERQQYEEKQKAKLKEADHGADITKRYLLSKMVVCEATAANVMDAFCDQCAKERSTRLRKLCQEARVVTNRMRRPFKRMEYQERKAHEKFVKELEGYSQTSFQLWNMCYVAVNNSEFKGSENLRTTALMAYFWITFAREFYHKALDVLPCLYLKMADPDALKELAYAAIGEGVELPDFTIMKGVYSNILAEIIK